MVFSCNAFYSSEIVTIRASIVPLPRFAYLEDEHILLSVQSDANHEYSWSSSLQGDIGTGRDIVVLLQEGTHTIKLRANEAEVDSVDIVVSPVTFAPGYSRSMLLTGESNELLVAAGRYCPALVSVSKSIVSILNPEETTSASSTPNSLKQNSIFFSGKMFSISIDQRRVVNDKISRRNSENRSRLPELGSLRTFIVPDTTGATSTGHSIEAEAVFVSARLICFVESASVGDRDNLRLFCEKLNLTLLPRVFQIWEDKWYDYDANGAVSVLLTSTINKESKAIGFFNPNDLFPFDNDSSSRFYNPLSNEMDVIYLADPTYCPDIYAYSESSIFATFAHELTHLLNFSHKLLIADTSGNGDIIQEELFLDEGLAHLTESLCGYGVSGGNLAFFSVYLQNTSEYSFCGRDSNGAYDSVGKRGLASAFLSWLFWKKGGMSWDPDSPINIIDTGGISFLRSLLKNEEIGLENLEDVLGASVESLFADWVIEINFQRSGCLSFPNQAIDPLTLQAVTITPFYGDLILNGNSYPLCGPVSTNVFSTHRMAEYSAAWLDPVEILEKHRVPLKNHDAKDRVFSFFSMY